MELIHLLQVIELSEYWLTALKNNVIWILLQIEDDFTKIKAVWIYRIRSDYVTRLWSWIKLLCKLYFISVFSLRLTLSFFLLEINFGGMAKYKNPVNALAFKTFLLSRQVIWNNLQPLVKILLWNQLNAVWWQNMYTI